jgi:hypothetical protein
MEGKIYSWIYSRRVTIGNLRLGSMARSCGSRRVTIGDLVKSSYCRATIGDVRIYSRFDSRIDGRIYGRIYEENLQQESYDWKSTVRIYGTELRQQESDN